MKIAATQERNMVRVMIGKKPMYLTMGEAWYLIDSLCDVLTVKLEEK